VHAQQRAWFWYEGDRQTADTTVPARPPALILTHMPTWINGSGRYGDKTPKLTAFELHNVYYDMLFQTALVQRMGSTGHPIMNAYTKIIGTNTDWSTVDKFKWMCNKYETQLNCVSALD